MAFINELINDWQTSLSMPVRIIIEYYKKIRKELQMNIKNNEEIFLHKY